MDFGTQVGLQQVDCTEAFSQDACKRRPRGFQEPQERPKSGSRVPQEPPRASQERPKVTKTCPGNAHGAIRGVLFDAFLRFSMFFCFFLVFLRFFAIFCVFCVLQRFYVFFCVSGHFVVVFPPFFCVFAPPEGYFLVHFFVFRSNNAQESPKSCFDMVMLKSRIRQRFLESLLLTYKDGGHESCSPSRLAA